MFNARGMYIIIYRVRGRHRYNAHENLHLGLCLSSSDRGDVFTMSNLFRMLSIARHRFNTHL